MKNQNIKVAQALTQDHTGIMRIFWEREHKMLWDWYVNMIRAYRQSNKEIKDSLLLTSEANSSRLLSRRYGRSWRLHKEEYSSYVNRILD